MESLRRIIINGKEYLIAGVSADGLTDEEVSRIAEALKDNIKAKIGDVTILADNWVGTSPLYAQNVTIEGVTENIQVDLTPSVNQLAIFYKKDLTFVTVNDGGVVTVYAIGQKPMNDYNIQATLTEVAISEKRPIIGVTVGTPLSPLKIKEMFAPYIRQQGYEDETGYSYNLEIGKEYKLVCEPLVGDPSDFEKAFISFYIPEEGEAITFSLPSTQADSLTLKILGIEGTIISYECNGELQTFDTSYYFAKPNLPYTLGSCTLREWSGEFYVRNPEGIAGGADGKDGVGISEIRCTSATSGAYRIEFTDGSYFDFIVPKGKDGADGKTPYIQDGYWYIDGVNTNVKAQGVDGKDGYTPIKGIDYYTDADKIEFSEYIASELAKRGQLKPEPAQTLADMTDTSLMYVLLDKSSPDFGYVFAHMTKTETNVPTNKIPLSINQDGTPFNNGQGWETGYALRADTGTPNDNSYKSYEASGFIRVNGTDILRIKDFAVNSTATAYDNITLYDIGFNILGAYTQASSYNPITQFVTNGVFEGQLASPPEKTNINADKLAQIAYIRLSFNKIDNTTMLTVNEPLEATTTTLTDWFSTGIKFVADDNTERIDNLENRVSILEKSDGENVASYVREEAKRVAKRVYSHQNANTFTFLAISDMHYIDNYSNIAQSLIHAGQGMDLVRKYANVDFATCLGDNGWGSGVEGSAYRATIEMGIEEIRSANACIDSAFRGIPNFRSVGNHDSLVFNYTFNNNDYLDAQELFPLYGAYNRGAVFHNGNKERGYCYRDFEDWKLRVICMNTSDLQELSLPNDMQKPVYVSGTQGKWFAETIDLSNKADAEEWSILILSHAPLDWGYRCIYLCDILKAYVDGNSISVERDGVTISYNYSGKNKAKIIGNCHGHNHNFQVDYLRRLVSDTTTEPITIKRFCIPNACFERSNERGENGLESGTDGVYDIEYGEEISCEKVAGTSQDTAFCVVTIDIVARKIYADCYGAGIDREISY